MFKLLLFIGTAIGSAHAGTYERVKSRRDLFTRGTKPPSPADLRAADLELANLYAELTTLCEEGTTLF